tara:strand:- start:175 stop:720 length:546 start_codon:yes stop_codon:yes gene_type:complete
MAYDNMFKRYQAGIQNVGSFQVSGHPFITGGVFLPVSHGSIKGSGMGVDADDHPQAVGTFDTIEFPKVTKTITIINTNFYTGSQYNSTLGDGVIHVYFGDGGEAHAAAGNQNSAIAQNHYITLPNTNDSITLDIKTNKVHIANGAAANSASFQLLAELTLIEPGEMYELTGSGISELTGSS